MPSTNSESSSRELVLAFLGFLLLVYPSISLFWTLTIGFYQPLVGAVLAAVVSLVAAVVYLRRGQAVGDLGLYLLSVTALAVVFAVGLRFLIAIVGPALSSEVIAVLFLSVYFIAYYLAYIRGMPRLRARAGL